MCRSELLLALSPPTTAAGITLNGAPLGSAANAHRPHAFDASGKLAPGTNTLSLLLPSPVHFAAQQAAAYPYPVPATQVGRITSPCPLRDANTLCL